MPAFRLVIKDRDSAKKRQELLVDETGKEIKDKLGDLAYMHIKPRKSKSETTPTKPATTPTTPTTKSIKPKKKTIKENEMIYSMTREQLAERNKMKLNDILEDTDTDIRKYLAMKRFIEQYGQDEFEARLGDSNFWEWFEESVFGER